MTPTQQASPPVAFSPSVVYGYKAVRPQMMMQFLPPDPPTKAELIVGGAKIGVIAATGVSLVVAAFMANPMLFAMCFIMGLAQGLMACLRSR